MPGPVPICGPPDCAASDAGRGRMQKGRTFLSWTAMAMLTATAVASVRGLPAMAPYGWASIFLYILPAIVFMVPIALVAAELASAWKGGVFVWAREAFGDQIGFSAIW